MSSKKEKNVDRDSVGGLPGIDYFTQRKTFAQKSKNNFEWAERMADYYDYFVNGSGGTNKKNEKLKLNYELFNGRAPTMMDYQDDFTKGILQEEGIELGNETVKHHDVISQVAQALVGEQRKRPLTAIAIDTSGNAMNQRKRERLELYQDYLRENIVAPMEQQLQVEFMQENGIEDPNAMKPEDQQKMQQAVQQQMAAKTPQEITEYMRKEFRTPAEIQAQKLIDYLMKELDIKFTTDEGFKHSIITGEEIYHVGIRHNEPILEVINPMGFTCSGTASSMFIEDSTWAKYEQDVKYIDLFSKYGDQFTESDIKKLEGSMFSSDSGYGDSKIKSELLTVISNNPEIVSGPGGIDPRTREGQSGLGSLMNSLSNMGDNYSEVRVAHITWKSQRKLKYVTRVLEDGTTKTFWIDESYTFNPLEGDIKQKIVWVPEVWQTTKIGYGDDAVYVDKGPLPYQYKSLDSPFYSKLPYYGVYYGKLMGNAENVSPLDRGKPWQYKFNVQLARMEEMETTDLGNVLQINPKAIPKDWSFGKYLMMMKYGKMAILDTDQEGAAASNDTVRSLNLSNTQSILEKVQYLEFLKNQVALAMSYNPSRLGQISPYMTATNNQQNIVQSSNQTEDLYAIHNKVVQNLLNALIKAARIAYKDNPIKKSYILDDMSIAELELDTEMLDRSEIGVFISNSSEDFENLKIIKGLAQSMIQSGIISYADAIKLQWARSGAEILNLASNAEEKMQQNQQAQQQAAQEQQEKQQKLQLDLLEKENQIKMLMQDKELASKERAVLIDSMKFKNQMDVNQDNVSDSNERAAMERDFNKVENDKDRMLKKELAEKDFENKLKIAAKKKPTGV